MTKRIEILHVFSNGKMLEPTGRQKRKHSSYAAAVRTLEVGESATVSVKTKSRHPLSTDGWVLDGYGEIQRISDSEYSIPRRLHYEY